MTLCGDPNPLAEVAVVKFTGLYFWIFCELFLKVDQFKHYIKPINIF